MFSWTKLRTELRFSPFSFSGQCKQKVMGSILTSMSDFGSSLIFVKNALESVRAVFGQSLVLSNYSYFQEDLVIVVGQYLGSFTHFRTVFGQYLDKK